MFFGLFVGLIGIYIYEIFDNTIKTVDDVESVGLSILSMIPMSLMHNKVALCENNDTLGLFLAVSKKSKVSNQKNKPFSGLKKLLKTKDKD